MRGDWGIAVCLVCGRFENLPLNDAMGRGWVFLRCPECQRGTPFDIVAIHLLKTIPENYLEGFCPEHWFKDSGVCAYCKMKRSPLGLASTGEDLA